MLGYTRQEVSAGMTQTVRTLICIFICAFNAQICLTNGFLPTQPFSVQYLVDFIDKPLFVFRFGDKFSGRRESRENAT